MVSGPAGAGKSHHVRSHTDPARTVWLTLRDQRDGSELAARLVRQLRTKVTSLPASLAAAVGPARITLTASDGTASTSTSFSVTIVSALLPATGSDATHHLSWFAGALIALGAALRGLGRRSSWRQRVAR